LGLLKLLQGIEFFSEMRLVGGTALALQMGHRQSIDIDLFGKFTADEFELSKELGDLGQFNILKKTKNILISNINGIKVDIVNYPYKWIGEPIISDGIVMAGKHDIAAMKIAAITGRGTKKDFIDLFFLLQDFSLSEILVDYEKKYHDGNIFMAVKSLNYFADAEEEQMPFMLKNVEWETVKSNIKMHLDNYAKG
jgi:hypothetical protein